ncbi:MAG: hypothetical protein P0107_01535 [Nitrosomonas sp.]|nr:hypothetical protein [Nitrosomonas sp.]
MRDHRTQIANLAGCSWGISPTVCHDTIRWRGSKVKLSLELSKRDTERTLYILDEPTTGLVFADIDLLLRVLHRLRDNGNTVVIIEHNLDVIKTADWIIDSSGRGKEVQNHYLANT